MARLSIKINMKILLLAVFFFITAAACLGGSALSQWVELLYTPAAILLGLYLFRFSPPMYLTFCMALWMFTPFIRRVVDYHSSYHPQSLVMLAPFLVSCLCIVSLRKIPLKRPPAHMLPYIGIMGIVMWGYFIGIFQSGLFAATYAALTWAGPILLAIHILVHPREIDANAEHVFKVFSICALIMGGYGLYQFLIYPEWDKYWVANANMGGIGIASAANVRIFSTMNSPAVFALFLATGILTLLSVRGRFRLVLAAIAISALMLSLVRSMWAFFLMAFIMTMSTMSWKKRFTYMIASLLLVALSLPLMLVGPISNQVQSRLQTFGDVNNDISFNARATLYQDFTQKAIASMGGKGLGQTGTASRLSESSNINSLDSGVLDLLYTFGILSLPLFFLLFMLALYLMRRLKADSYAQLSASIALAMIAQLVFFNVLYAPSGIVFFVFSAIALTKRPNPSVVSDIRLHGYKV